MKRNPEYFPYILRSGARLNARHAARDISGVLLKSDGGYSCLQPWENLGDAPLEQHLASLRAGRPTLLAERALVAAAEDGAARRAGHSLFAGLEIPESHATLLLPPSVESLEPWVKHGFGTIKAKAGPDWRAGMESLVRAADTFPMIRWRFDFNGSLTPSGFLEWAESLPCELKDKIDFVEDPVPFDAETWKYLESSTGLRLAADTACAEPAAVEFIGICKPTRDQPETILAAALAAGRRMVVTSNMDHCLGIARAAFWAARFARAGLLAGPCGLCTHLIFERDAFTGEFGPPGPRLRAPAGTGLGFDRLLGKLEWKN